MNVTAPCKTCSLKMNKTGCHILKSPTSRLNRHLTQILYKKVQKIKKIMRMIILHSMYHYFHISTIFLLWEQQPIALYWPTAPWLWIHIQYTNITKIKNKKINTVLKSETHYDRRTVHNWWKVQGERYRRLHFVNKRTFVQIYSLWHTYICIIGHTHAHTLREWWVRSVAEARADLEWVCRFILISTLLLTG